MPLASLLSLSSEDQADISSLAWAGDGAYLAIGNDYGEVEIWDVEQSKKIRTMAGHRVSFLSCPSFGLDPLLTV